MAKILRIVLVGALTAALVVAFLQLRNTSVETVIFEDISAGSGIEYRGITHGAAWGDFDGDGLPDLYVTNHLNNAKLYRNLGQGRFSDVTEQFLSSQDLGGDKHGAAWADYDNDGRLDLVQLMGAGRGVGEEPKRLLKNTGAKFENVANALGVSNPYGRTRMPLWFDFNRDGLLDLFQGAEKRFDGRTPPFMFVQEAGKFHETQALKFTEQSVPFCIAADLNGDNLPELVCRVAGGKRTSTVIDMAKQLPHELAGLLPPTAFQDMAAADFDNDGAIDLYLARKNPPGKVALARPAANELIADVHIDHTNLDKPAGFTFTSSGNLTVKVASAWPADAVSPARVHLGKQGAHPSDLTFTLSSEGGDLAGIASNGSNKEPGVYIGKIGSNKWEVRIDAPREHLVNDRSNYQETALKITGTQPIDNVEALGETVTAEEAPGRLFMNRDGKLVEESDKRGVNKRSVAAMNVVAGDFNNDMYVDLFVLASGDVGKQENLLLLNRGDGRFNVVRAGGGAGGSLVGVGDSVTTADYDGDGYLDLLTTTGGSMGRSLGLPSENGGYQLYHNIGKGNHWIEIDLEGTTSNRDGIGAVVRITAGGVNQVRVQDGGVHERGQNHARLHFGLAKHTRVDKIAVHWPSGAVQVLRDIPADQVLRIKESLPPT